MYFGVSSDKCQKVAYEFAKANGISVLSSWKRNCKAGYDWFKSFSSKHNFSFIISESTSIARATAFNCYVANKFYDNLTYVLRKTSVLEKHPFKPQDIYNCHESGCYMVHTPGVSTDEGKVSSNPAQSGIRNSNCFGSKGFNRCFKMRMKENNLGYTNL